MTQEVDEFLETPDSVKAEALSKEQLLEAWDKVKTNTDGTPTVHKDSGEILQDATDTYIIDLAGKSFDEMTSADLETIRSLSDKANKELCGEAIETISKKVATREHALAVAEAHQAIDDLVADDTRAEAQTFASYMHAYLDGQREFLDPEEATIAGAYAHDVINGESYEDLPGELKGSMAGFVYQTNPPTGNNEYEILEDEATPVVEEIVELADNTDAYMAHLDEVIEAGGEDGRKAQAFKDMLEGRADEGSMAERLQRQTDIMDWYQQDTYAINDDGEEHPGEFGKVTSVAQRADEYLDNIAEQAQSEEFQRDAAFFAAPEEVQSYVERLHGVIELPQNENGEENTADLGEEFLNQVNEHRAGIGLDAIENPLNNDEDIIDEGFEEEEDDNDFAVEPLGSEGEELDDTPADAGTPETEDKKRTLDEIREQLHEEIDSLEGNNLWVYLDAQIDDRSVLDDNMGARRDALEELGEIPQETRDGFSDDLKQLISDFRAETDNLQKEINSLEGPNADAFKEALNHTNAVRPDNVNVELAENTAVLAYFDDHLDDLSPMVASMAANEVRGIIATSRDPEFIARVAEGADEEVVTHYVEQLNKMNSGGEENYGNAFARVLEEQRTAINEGLDDVAVNGTDAPADTDENDGAVDEVTKYMAHLQEDVDNGVPGAAEFQDALAKKDEERTFDDVNAEMKRQMAVGRYMENDYENMPRQIKSDSVKIDAQDVDFMVDKENQRLVAQNGNPETVAEYVSYKDEHHFDAKKFLENVNKLRAENGWGEPFTTSKNEKPEAEDEDKDKPKEEKSEDRKAVEEYLNKLPTTEKVKVGDEEKEQPIEGAKEYKEYMLRQLDLKENPDKEVDKDPSLAGRLSTYKYMQYLEGHAADLPEAPKFVEKVSGKYAEAEQKLVVVRDPTITDAGKSDNIEDVKAFDEYLKTFGTGNEALDKAAEEMRAQVDEERANHGQMPVEEALFLANTDKDTLKKRDEEISKLLEGDDIKNMLDADMAEDADWKQINDFYDLVKVDRMDSANLVMPNPIDKKVKEEAKAPSSEGTEGEAHEEPETEESKKKKQSGQELKKDLYDLAILKASKELMMADDYDALSEEDRKKRLAELTKRNMAEMTYQLAANQFAYDTAGAGHFRKDGSLMNKDEIATHGKEVLGHLMGDPSAKGFIHISDTVAAATMAANTMPLKNFTDQLQNKVESSALFQKVKALDERLTKKYPKAYPIAKQIIAKGATRLAIGYAAGPIGLAVYSGIETVKACKKIRDDYRQQKREGNVDGKWNYFKKNWPKVVGAAASVAGTAVAAWTGIDAIRLNGVDGLGAIGHMFSGEHAASSSVGIAGAAKNLVKNTWEGTKNIFTGNLHEYSAKQVASLARASMTLASGLGAASQSFAKGDWKQGWAQFGGAFLGATVAAVMLESQAAHAAEMPPAGGHINTGSDAPQLGQETGGLGSATQGGAAEGLSTNNEPPLIYDPKTGQMVPNPKFSDLSDATKGALNTPIVPETPEETIAKAEQTIKNVENFKTPKVGLGDHHVVGVKAPKIELDPEVEKIINDPNAVPKVPEDYQGNGGKGGNQQVVSEEQKEVKQEEVVKEEEKTEEKEQKQVVDEQQEETTITAPERLAVELEDPKETRVDLSTKMDNGEDASLKIETARNGVLAHKVVGDKTEEVVSAVDKETGLRRTVKVTYDNQGRVVSEQEIADKEARKFVKEARKLDNTVNKENGGVSDDAKKTYKMIKRSSSTEIRHPKSVISMQQNEDGLQSLTRGRNGLSGITTLDGKEAHFSIIKDKDGMVHYVVTEENGHQRLMTDSEQEKVTKQIEESGDKKSIRKLHKFAKKPEYEAPQHENEAQQQQQSADMPTQEVIVESSPKELGFKQGNAKMSVTLNGNGRAQYTIEQNGIKEPMNPEQVKDFNKMVDKAQSEGTITQDNLALQRVRTSEGISDFATKKLHLDNETMKVSVPVADGKVQAAIAVADNGAVYHPAGGKTTYAVVDEHKQVKAYTIQDNKSVQMNAQDTARFVGVLKEKGMVNANSSLGKAINNMQQTAGRQSQQASLQR